MVESRGITVIPRDSTKRKHPKKKSEHAYTKKCELGQVLKKKHQHAYSSAQYFKNHRMRIARSGALSKRGPGWASLFRHALGVVLREKLILNCGVVRNCFEQSCSPLARVVHTKAVVQGGFACCFAFVSVAVRKRRP